MKRVRVQVFHFEGRAIDIPGNFHISTRELSRVIQMCFVLLPRVRTILFAILGYYTNTRMENPIF